MIEITCTHKFENRERIEEYSRGARGETSLRDKCRQYLADNPETKTLRDLGVAVTTKPVGVNGWWSATAWCHGNKHECQHRLADAAVKGLLDMKVPV